MELIFRQRIDRPDKNGRVQVFGDLHWAGGHRWKVPTGVKVLPAHWQPTKAKRINTSATDANQLNLRLTRLTAAIQGVFLAAEAAGTPEANVTRGDIEAAVAMAGVGGRRRAKPVSEPAASVGLTPLTPTSPWEVFAERWKIENTVILSESYLRSADQVVSGLCEFDPTLRLGTLTKERLAQYTAWLYAQTKLDSTVLRHYKFLRECMRMVNQAVPRWLGKFTARYGRPLALKRAEIQSLIAADFSTEPNLALERDAFLLQTLLSLRDVELRALRQHHVSDHYLPNFGEVPCVALYQEKTGEPVYIPLPEPARAIWQRYNGPPPLPSQQERNRLLKELGLAVGLTRQWVKHSFSGKVHHEELLPVWRAMTTHTARHTGAAMVLLGSEGDQTLKEIALGHVTKSAYGYDTLERYGPLLLQAWAEALEEVPVTFVKIPRRAERILVGAKS